MADYKSKYSGEQVEGLLDQVASGSGGGGGSIVISNVFETDFTFEDLAFEDYDLQQDMEALAQAIIANKQIYIPYSRVEPMKGGFFANASVDTEDNSLYLYVYDHLVLYSIGTYRTNAGIMRDEITRYDLQDKLVSGTNIKTINGQSLLGGGNITIEGGGGSGGGLENYPIITERENVVTLDPNKYYMLGQRDNLFVNLNSPTDESIVNEYIFEFEAMPGAYLTISPSDIIWANGDTPPMSAGKKYVISIVNGLAVYAEF